MDWLVQLIEKMDAHVLDSVHLQIDINPVSSVIDVEVYNHILCC